jgi:hypothetical protein
MICRWQEAYLGDSEFSSVGVPSGIPTAPVFKGKIDTWGAHAGEDGEET